MFFQGCNWRSMVHGWSLEKNSRAGAAMEDSMQGYAMSADRLLILLVEKKQGKLMANNWRD